MSTIGFIIALIFTGLIVGALARLLLPGRDPMSIFQTILIGIAGSLVAGLIAYYAFDKQEGPGFLLSIICTVGLVYAVRKTRENKTTRE
ncbi:MAG: GlsB/YeaQ/YmgE family stress response membrane protein [Solirubrobacterales bacterium]